jgi:hypothetical protein
MQDGTKEGAGKRAENHTLHHDSSAKRTELLSQKRCPESRR